MLDKKVKELLNTQVNKEFFSAYLYLGFANYYEDEGLSGFNNWYTIQAQEERDHAMLMLKYLQMNGETVDLLAIEKPAQEFKDHMHPLKEALAHERYVTSLINNIYGTAYELKDFRTMQFLDWFVKEQVEEKDGNVRNRCKGAVYVGSGAGRQSLFGTVTDIGLIKQRKI